MEAERKWKKLHNKVGNNQALHYSCQFKKMPLVLGRKTFNFKKPKETAKQTLRLIQHLPACNSKPLAIIQLIVNNKMLSVSCLMIA